MDQKYVSIAFEEIAEDMKRSKELRREAAALKAEINKARDNHDSDWMYATVGIPGKEAGMGTDSSQNAAGNMYDMFSQLANQQFNQQALQQGMLGSLGGQWTTTTGTTAMPQQAMGQVYHGFQMSPPEPPRQQNRVRRFFRINEYVKEVEPSSKRFEEPLDELRLSVADWLLR